MKTSKRILALMLSALMIFSVAVIPGVDMSMFGVKADAADDVITLSDDTGFSITQQRVVTDYASKYAQYQSKYFNGATTNWPTNFVIPGLSSADDYTPQGMTYWAEKEWILISAYDANTEEGHVKQNSVIYAIDAVSEKMVAVFKIFNSDGNVNTSHGGGIAASEYNFYYADTGSNISYWPLSEMDVPDNTVKDIYIRDSISCSGELYGGSALGSAATSYCCYDEGILWTGNFFLSNDDYPDYGKKANSAYNSMLMGYKLMGNSSEEEWFYLQDKNQIDPIISLNTAKTVTSGTSSMTYTATLDENGYFDITGNATGTEGKECNDRFGSAYLYEGYDYSLEFDLPTATIEGYADFYFLKDGTTASYTNIKYAAGGDMSVTDNGDGTYHYQLLFSPGKALKNAQGSKQMDGNWDTTTNDVTGTYQIRFDMDSINTDREIEILNVHISEYSSEFAENELSARNCAGNPTYAIALDNIYDKVQYAMVDNGKIYMSRSWSRNLTGSTHTRALAIANIDLNAPGTETLTVNNRTRNCHLVKSSDVTSFGLDNNTPTGTKYTYDGDILAMGEALCVMDGYLYMFGESAAWHYNGKDSSSVCKEPVDVIWKIDQHAIMGAERPADDVSSIYYEKVNSLSEIENGEEYLIVYESDLKDPVTQKNILYALDSYGGYNGNKLPKKTNLDPKATGDSMGIIGYPITEYTTDEYDRLYINETDDARDSIRWKLTYTASNTLSAQSSDYYYENDSYLTFNNRVFSMSSTGVNFGIENAGKTGTYYLSKDGSYLWCNDGTIDGAMEAYNEYYANHGITDYLPSYNGCEEIAGTFHTDALYTGGTNGGNKLGRALAGAEFENGYFSLYKKVPDPYASTTGTDVYTDLKTELQSDGTYTMTLETYATAAVQYMELEETRPTDFIFVLDTSNSMNSNDCSGYVRYTGSLQISSILSEDDTADDHGTNNIPYIDHATSEQIYYRAPDGGYYRVYGAMRVYSKKNYQGYWIYYIKDGLRYMLNGTNSIGWTADELRNNMNSDVGRAAYTEKSTNGKNWLGQDGRRQTTIYTGEHFRYDNAGAEATRLAVMRDIVNSLTYKIAADNTKHRISLITFANAHDQCITYTTTGSTFNSNPTDYSNVYFESTQFADLRNIVNNLGTQNTGTQPSTGLTRAANQIDDCGQDYSCTGDKAACVFLFTDGNLTNSEGTDNFDYDNIANDAIAKAKDIKNYGAFIYTVKVGNNSATNLNNFFEYTSSNYINSTSVSNAGIRNKNSDIDYTLEVSTGSLDLNGIATSFVNAANATSSRAYLQIDENTIIREAIGDFFLTGHLALNDFSVETVDSKFDGLGRLTFDESTRNTLVNEIVINDNNNDGKLNFEDGQFIATNDLVSVNAHTLMYKGFDFTENYIAEGHDGKKLVITIKNLLLNPDYNLTNAKATKDASTGIYLNQEFLEDNNARKGYPVNTIHVPEYTYVLDYGIGMYDSDVNGTLCSIDDQPRKQSTYKTELTEDNVKNNVTIKTVNGNQDLVYGLKSDATGSNNSGYCLIQRPDDTYDWFKINVIPASNVYFEEDSATVKTVGQGTPWTHTGDTTEFSQSLTSVNDVYGYDETYLNNGSDFSLGTVYESSVSDTATRSDTLTFNYTGTALDLYGSCGANTGIYIITIRDASGKVEKVYITDTYLSDSTLYTDGTKINQVPIIHHENTNGFGKYTVEVTSAFLSSMVGQRNPATTFAMRDTEEGVNFYSADISEEAAEAVLLFAEMEDLMGEDIEVTFCDENSVLNGGTGADVATTFGFFSIDIDTDREYTELTNYFDGFRVYQPAGPGAGDGMYPEYEQSAVYYNVVENLLSADDITVGDNGIAYIETVEDEDYNFGTYEGNGPKNELYLKPDKSIAFNVTATTSNAKAMVSLRAVNGDATAVINGAEFTVTNTSEMYYRIDNLTFDENGNAVITIENEGSTILVVDTVKIANGLMGVMMMSAMPRVRMMMAAPAVETEPNAPIEEDVEVPPMPENPPYVEPFPETPDVEEPSTEPEDGTDNTEEKGFFEQLTENFTKLLDMIQSMLNKIVNLLKSLMA